jgi:cytochrome c-type biogenesis protein CcmH
MTSSTPAMATDLNPLRRQIRQIGAVLALALATMAVGGYVWLGRAPAAATGPAVTASSVGTETAPHAMEQDQMRAMVDALAERLARHPDDAAGWGMLARSYAVLGDHAQAVPAFRKAAAGRPDDPVLLADFADALAVTHGQRIEGEPLKLVERALAFDPRNLKALSLAGTAAYDRQDFKAAVGFWERLQQAGAPEDVLVRQVALGMAEARQRAGLSAPQVAGVALGRSDLRIERP